MQNVVAYSVMSKASQRNLAKAGALFHQGDVAGAQRLAQQVIKSEPQFVDGWLFLSKLALAVNHVAAAAKLIASAAKIEPQNVRVLAHQAYVHAMGMRHKEALTSLPGIEAKADCDADAWSDIGNAYHICGDLTKAQRAFKHALELAPDNATFQYNLATSYKFSGDFQKAEELADGVIKKTPADWAVYEFRSGLRTQTKDRNHIAELTALLDNGIRDPGGEVKVAYALAKEYEDIDDLTAAFSYCKRAADTRRKGMNYDVAGDVSALAAVKAKYTPDFLKTRDGFEDDRPIFIVGLPRTGTTLLDRIISSHTDVMSAGELQDFGNVLVQRVLQATPGVQHNKLSMVQAATEINHAQLGEDYSLSTQARTAGSRHFVDKLPINYLYLGSIATALPKATLIHMDRHPMDAAYAIYKILFSDAYPFSYDLGDLGHYYVAYRKLMDYWHLQLGDRLLRVRYEDLVKDTEGQAKRVINHIGLEWQEQCLNYHRSTQPTNTASAVQVRQKVYTSSIGKWRRLVQQLAPFRKIVEEAGYSCDA